MADLTPSQMLAGYSLEGGPEQESLRPLHRGPEHAAALTLPAAAITPNRTNRDGVDGDDDDEQQSDWSGASTPSLLTPVMSDISITLDRAVDDLREIADSSRVMLDLSCTLDRAASSLEEVAKKGGEDSLVSSITCEIPRRGSPIDEQALAFELPSYDFHPSVGEKFDRMLRSFVPRRAPTLLRAWRRSQRVRAAGVGEPDDERGSCDHRRAALAAAIFTSDLPKDTYSFIYAYPACPPSAPILYASFLFSFRSLVYGLLLSSLVDVHRPHNPLGVPLVVSLETRIAQACAILIAVFNNVDILVAMDNLLRTPDAIVVRNDPNTIGEMDGARIQAAIYSSRVGFRFKFANMLRLVEGCLAMAASFILIVRSRDVIEIFVNFAALEFVINLDNLAFALAERGLISGRLQDAARFVGELGFSYSGHLDGGTCRNTKKDRIKGGGSYTSSSRCLAMLKGSFFSCIFRWPVCPLTRRPDATRRTALFIMTLSLLCSWGFILSELNHGDFLCKSLDVEFFHAHVRPSSEVEADEGIKPFLASRSGTYVATFMEQDMSLLDKLLNLFTARSKLFLAYRKADLRIEAPQQDNSLVPSVRLPEDYIEVVFFDSSIKRWVFTACDPNTDLSREGRVCSGPEVHSAETDAMDLIELSSSLFYVENEGLYASSMALPASITCNECSLQKSSELKSMESNVRTCGLIGGECSAPQAELGFSRQCLCPQGQYGLFCADHYGTWCPILEIIRHTDHGTIYEEPPGVVHFLKQERTPFTLLENQHGGGNTPVWQRRNRDYTDRMEWRGGTHWTITREFVSSGLVHTFAIADSSPATGDTGSAGLHGGPVNSLSALQIQPPPAGLVFHAPKATAWGTLPDYARPYSSYRFHCKAAPLGQLAATP